VTDKYNNQLFSRYCQEGVHVQEKRSEKESSLTASCKIHKEKSSEKCKRLLRMATKEIRTFRI
jgi:hypothetical protein